MPSTSTLPPFKINPWLIAAAVIIPTFMEVLDTTIVSVSLPHIAGSLSVSNNEATWVQTSYLVSNAIVLPASGWFSNFFGRKRFLITCITLFTIASFVCGIAPTLGILVLARVIQGAGGGALQPISQAILLESFPPAQHGVAMAVYGLGIILAPVLGPVLGGWVTDHYTWRWLFYLNIPIGFAAVWMVRQFIFDPEYVRNAKPGKIDVAGFVLMIVWLATMQTVLDKGQDADWFSAPWICWFTAISIISFIAFVLWELRSSQPIANLRVFKNSNFTIGTLLISCAGVILYGRLTILPLFLQGLMGYDALQSGLVQMSSGLGALIAMPTAGILISRIESRKVIATGFIIMCIAMLKFGSLTPVFDSSQLFFPNLILGIGMGMTMVPLLATSMGMLKKEQMGNATGLFSLARNLAGSIGIAYVTTMVERGTLTHQAMLVSHVTPYDHTYQMTTHKLQTALASHGAQAADMANGVVYQWILKQSTILAYIDNFRMLALLCIIALPCVFLLKRIKPAGGAAAMH